MRYIFGLFIVLAAAYTVCARFSDASIARLPPPPTPFYTSLPASTTIVARGYGAENVPAESVAFPIALVGDPIPGTWQFADVATIAEGPSVDITQDQVNDAVSQLRKKLGALRIEATTAPAPTVQPHEYGAWMTRPVRGAPPTHAPYPPIVGLITIHAAPSNASQVLAAVANLRVPGASVVRMNLELASKRKTPRVRACNRRRMLALESTRNERLRSWAARSGA